ncbi:matotopetli isoform X2 [Haematobia irritans]|uniref:matotopetli isoform X2 n=1 Tax=Haematobia irritans TaxID=7368 RepID=UPI003F4F6387
MNNYQRNFMNLNDVGISELFSQWMDLNSYFGDSFPNIEAVGDLFASSLNTEVHNDSYAAQPTTENCHASTKCEPQDKSGAVDHSIFTQTLQSCPSTYGFNNICDTVTAMQSSMNTTPTEESLTQHLKPTHEELLLLQLLEQPGCNQSAANVFPINCSAPCDEPNRNQNMQSNSEIVISQQIQEPTLNIAPSGQAKSFEGQSINLAIKKTLKESLEAMKDMPLEPTGTDCIRLIKENQIRIRRFLKEELSYDIYASENMTSKVTTLMDAKSSSKISHKCTFCERKFVHASGLLRHMEKHTMDLPSTSDTHANQPSNNTLRVVIKCILCGRIFFERKSAFQHLCSHFSNNSEDERETDNYGDVSYEAYIDEALNFLKLEENSKISNGLKHSDTKNNKYFKIVILNCVLQCEFCDFVFSDVSDLFKHSSCHRPERPFECFSCDIYVKTAKAITNHWTECVYVRENIRVYKVSIQRYFVCNVCENKFESIDILLEHRYTTYHFYPRLNKRTGILQMPCGYCDELFESVQDSLAHYEERHSKKNKGEKDVSERVRLHLCDVCGKSYTQSSHLRQHLRFHEGVKPFACKESGCTRKFTIRADLNDHIRKCHTFERPYQCTTCGKRFLTGSVFYQHRLIHRRERRYECEECGKRFYRADALKNHQRIHSGEKPFGCHFCTKNFRQRGDREKHIKARHSKLDENGKVLMQIQKLKLQYAAAIGGEEANTIMPEQSTNDVMSTMHANLNNPIDFGIY